MEQFRKPHQFNYQRCACNPGSRFVDSLSLVYSDKGGKHLQKVGETNHYEVIQSYKDSCDLNLILNRCMRSGDYSLLQRVQGAFTDISSFPVDARFAHDIMKHSRLVYDSLDAKQKVFYPTFDSFLDAFATKENFDAFVKNFGTQNVVNNSVGDNNES